MIYTYYKQWGNQIFFSYINENGDLIHNKIKDYEPVLYTKVNDTVDTKFKSIFDYKLKENKFPSIKDAKSYFKSYSGVEGVVIEGNYKFANQYVIELYEGEIPSYQNVNIRGCILDIEVSSPTFPKPEEALYPIDAITLFDIVDNKFTSMGMGKYIHDMDILPTIKDIDFEYIECKSEDELLINILNYFRNGNFNFTSGWNSEQFDMVYIINRMYKILGEKSTKKISPYNMINKVNIFNSFGGQSYKYEIVGLPHLDYMHLYKTHVYTPRESYSLGFIAHEELGDEKLSYEEEGTLLNLSSNNFQKYISYNIKDVDIIKRLDEKLGIFNITKSLAYFTLSNYEDTLGTVRIWEQLIAKEFYKRGMIPLCDISNNINVNYPGGYVSDPIRGYHDWVVSYDLNSLYPHLEMQINISPETYIKRNDLPDELVRLSDQLAIKDISNYYNQVMNLVNKEVDLSLLKKYNVSMSACGHFYRKDIKGIIPTIKEEIYTNRKKYKKNMLRCQQEIDILEDKADEQSLSMINKLKNEEASSNSMQMALKILLNSGYGALANNNFAYYNPDNAESITTTGQLVNRWSSERVNALINTLVDNKKEKRYIIANDTDSMYVELKDLVNLICSEDKLSINDITDKINEISMEVIEPEIKKYTNEMSEYLNSYENKMVWEREVISPVVINTAKKRYVMLVSDSEGVRFRSLHMKVVGLESKRSSTPLWARDALNKCYEFALNKERDELYKFLNSFEKEFYKMNLNDISIPTGVNNIEKFMVGDGEYIKGTPRQVKAAINYNFLIKKHNLSHLPLITSGNKIKTLNLKKINPINRDVIGFISSLPKEFDLDDYIDKRQIYEKGFLSPLNNFLKIINWSAEEIVELF